MSQMSEQRREQIVQTARRIVDEQGPSHLTAEAITHEIGVSRPLLYHYFQNVANLLDTVVLIYAEEFAAKLAVWDGGQSAAGGTGWGEPFVALLRAELVDGCPLCCDRDDVAGAGAYRMFVDACARAVVERAQAAPAGVLGWCLRADKPRLAMDFALNGLVEALRVQPEATDAELASFFERLYAPAVPAAAASTPAPSVHAAASVEAVPSAGSARGEDAVPESGKGQPEEGAPEPAAQPAGRRRGFLGRIFNG